LLALCSGDPQPPNPLPNALPDEPVSAP